MTEPLGIDGLIYISIAPAVVCRHCGGLGATPYGTLMNSDRSHTKIATEPNTATVVRVI
jgi:hypothetical protein